jgi:hypothetical protein
VAIPLQNAPSCFQMHAQSCGVVYTTLLLQPNYTSATLLFSTTRYLTACAHDMLAYQTSQTIFTDRLLGRNTRRSASSREATAAVRKRRRVA